MAVSRLTLNRKLSMGGPRSPTPISYNVPTMLTTRVGFADSGQNFSFGLEGDGVPILRAELFNVEGEAIPSDINISERIENQNGQFVFGESDSSVQYCTFLIYLSVA